MDHREAFTKKPTIAEANSRALKAGHALRRDGGDLRGVSYAIGRRRWRPGRYRNITGNSALAWGSWPPPSRRGLPVVLGAYPITPACDILHELSMHKSFGVRTFQAEDEIAAVASAIGAAFGGALGVTTTSGPGHRAQERGHRAGGDGRAAARDLRHPARRAVARACRRRPSRPT